MNKAVFLDRDGVINHEPGNYTYRWEDFRFNPGLFEALKTIQNRGFLLIIVTNQGGIAKGIYSKEDFNRLSQKMLEKLSEEGIRITDLFYSPHHDDHGRSLSRKPDSLLLERALFKYDIEPSKSYMIGDSERDIFAAEKVSVKGIHIESNTPLNSILEEIN